MIQRLRSWMLGRALPAALDGDPAPLLAHEAVDGGALHGQSQRPRLREGGHHLLRGAREALGDHVPRLVGRKERWEVKEERGWVQVADGRFGWLWMGFSLDLCGFYEVFLGFFVWFLDVSEAL